MPAEQDILEDPAAFAEAQRIAGERTWPATVRLGTPIEFGKETITELVFQKGNLGIIRGLNITFDTMPKYEELMAIAARLCGKSLKVIELLDPDDADEVITMAVGFFARCRGAGKKLSPR